MERPDEGIPTKPDVNIPHPPVFGDQRQPVTNPNSKSRADQGLPYEQITRPQNPNDAIDAINVWARYLHHWGRRIDNEFHAFYDRLRAAGTPTAHLDPPPEPFK
jgi:hypothetical protein